MLDPRRVCAAGVVSARGWAARPAIASIQAAVLKHLPWLSDVGRARASVTLACTDSNPVSIVVEVRIELRRGPDRSEARKLVEKATDYVRAALPSHGHASFELEDGRLVSVGVKNEEKC